MKDYLYDTGDSIKKNLKKGEEFLLNADGEESDFVRLNNNRVRQAGTVNQCYLSLTLVKGQRHLSETVTITGGTEDKDAVKTALVRLRKDIDSLPEDPHFLCSLEVNSTETARENRLPESGAVMEKIMTAGEGLDLVGMYAAGRVYSVFMNSPGQRNWFDAWSFNLDWSVYFKEDKAVKSGYAGYGWDDARFAEKMNDARNQLEVLGRPAKKIDPGKYRVFLSPRALAEIIGMLSWGGFSEKSIRTKNSSLLKLVEKKERLNEEVTLAEDVKEGTAPNFQGEGFIKPGKTVLVDRGEFAGGLVSPRSAREYGIDTNGANGSESPESASMEGGSIGDNEVLSALESGLYINNLWYLNYSDRPNCRITGMTRFATFWVDRGDITAPVEVMRFDETVYRMLGENLLGLTENREFIMDTGTYGGRSTGSVNLPGALVKDFSLTL